MLVFRHWISDRYSFILTYLLLIVDAILMLSFGLISLVSGVRYNVLIAKYMALFDSLDATFLLTLDSISSAFATLLYVALIVCFVFLRTYFEVDFFAKNICFLSAVFSQLALGFFLTGDLLLLIFFWEWISLVSFFLIQYWSFRVNTLKVSVRVFILSQLGDILFICGSFTLIATLRTTDILFISHAPTTLNMTLFLCTNVFQLNMLNVGVLALTAAVFLKSAQFIYYPWLLDAMEAPVPISSQLHSSTLVIIGFYIMFRFYFLFDLVSWLRNYFILLGSITSFSMAILAFFQFDGKRLLACSTASQLGYCIVALGFGFINESFVLLVFCCCNKAILFVTFGVLMSKLNGVSDFRLLPQTNHLVFERAVLCVVICNITIAPGAFIFHVKSLLSCGLLVAEPLYGVIAVDFLALSWIFSSLYAVNLSRVLFASNFFETNRSAGVSSVSKALAHNFSVRAYGMDFFFVALLTLGILCGLSVLASPYRLNLGEYSLNWRTAVCLLY